MDFVHDEIILQQPFFLMFSCLSTFGYFKGDSRLNIFDSLLCLLILLDIEIDTLLSLYQLELTCCQNRPAKNRLSKNSKLSLSQNKVNPRGSKLTKNRLSKNSKLFQSQNKVNLGGSEIYYKQTY